LARRSAAVPQNVKNMLTCMPIAAAPVANTKAAISPVEAAAEDD
jgi:hypothetical protein